MPSRRSCMISRKLRLKLAGSVFITMASCLLLSQSPTDKTSKESIQVSEERKTRILAEIETLKSHEWAGSYYYGDGLGVNVSLVLAPQNGFVFDWTGCLGLYDLNYGNIVEKDGRIK